MKRFRVDYMSKKESAKKFELECYICDKSYCIMKKYSFYFAISVLTIVYV